MPEQKPQKTLENKVRAPNVPGRLISSVCATLGAISGVFFFASGNGARGAFGFLAAIGFGLYCAANEEKTTKAESGPKALGSGFLSAAFTLASTQPDAVGYEPFVAIGMAVLTVLNGRDYFKLQKTDEIPANSDNDSDNDDEGSKPPDQKPRL